MNSSTISTILLFLTFLSTIYHVSAEDGGDCAFSEYALDDTGTTTLKIRSTETDITVVMESADTAWLGVGVSEEGLMIGSTGIIGSPSVGVKKYDLTTYEMSGVRISSAQTLIDTEFIQNEDGVEGSRLTYTQLLSDGDQELSSTGEITFIWAVGFTNILGIHASRGSIPVSIKPCAQFKDSGKGALSSGQLDKSSLKAHSIIATIAFGALMPLGILASNFREYFEFDIFSQKAWAMFHFILMGISALLAIVSFILAVAAKKGSGGAHFVRMHEIVGLLLMTVVFLQVIFAAFRPKKAHQHEEVDDEIDDETGEKNAPGPSKPSLMRKIWEKGHKMIGYVIILTASWQIKSGLNIYQFFFGESKIWIVLYWVWLGIIYSLMLLAIYRLFTK